MLTKEGHTKLTDFGMCKKVSIELHRVCVTDTFLRTWRLAISGKQPARSVVPQVSWPLKYSFTGSTVLPWTGNLSRNLYPALFFRWALGILTFNMLVGVPPFQARGDAVFKKIKTGRVVFPAKYVSYQRKKETNQCILYSGVTWRLISVDRNIDLNILKKSPIDPPFRRYQENPGSL